MDHSMAYQILFRHSVHKRVDQEALSRSDALTFERPFNDVRDSKRHGLSYDGVFGRMVVIYTTEIFIYVILTAYYMYLMMDLMESTNKAFLVVLEL